MRNDVYFDRPDFSFRSQSLDNETRDHVQIRGERVGDNTRKRQELAQSIDEVSRSGRRLYGTNRAGQIGSDVAAPIFYNDRFTLRVRTEELDRASRQTAVLCYGSVPKKPSSDWPCSVVSEIRAFARSIDRTISHASEEEARRGLDMILKTHGTFRSRMMRIIWRIRQWIRRERTGS